MLKATKKNRAKSHKDKTRNSAAQTFNISGPANTIVRQPGEGLYMKLINHQKNIATQLKFITSALEDNGHAQYRSRHKKMDLTSVVTALLVQLDNAVTTTHQCLTKDIFDKDASIRPELEKHEKGMYVGVAFIVQWIDFDSKGAGREMPLNREKMVTTIKEFEVSLAEVVRLVYQCQVQNGIVTTPSNHQRRSSIDSSTINTTQRQNSGGHVGVVSGSPAVGSNIDDLVHRGHPVVEHLRSEKSRKSSWAPISSSQIVGSLFRNKANTLMPMTNSRDSGLSEGSSGGASDEERRRSGSSDHYQSGGQSPEHNRDSMSSDWEGSRVRNWTTPFDRENCSSAVPIPVSAPVIPNSSLPPLPGEKYGTPPPPPKRWDEDERSKTLPFPSVPKKKGALRSLQLNGHTSPDLSSNRSRTTEDVDGDEVPPPVPIKKRNTSIPSIPSIPPTEMYPSHAHSSSIDEDTPPPVPVKVRRGTNSSNHQRGSVSSPNTTPTHTPTQASYRPINSQVQTDGGMVVHGVGGMFPPVPLRMESIPGVKTALGQETPPPKPPRSDRPNSAELLSPVHTRPSPLAGPQDKEAIHVFNTIRRYNEDIRKAKENGPDAAPPLPLKKKTVMIYKGLVQGYTYDESIMQPLYIPGMEAPPPIPPKKRKRRKQQSNDQTSSSLSDPSSSAQNQSSALQKLDQSCEDLEEGGEVNYLECEEATGYLIFNKEETGGYTLKGGPVDALIAYAASSAKSVMHFSEAFLLTYYTFITPDKLISKLLYRLTYFYRAHIQAIWQATTSLLVRALTVLKQPLSKASQAELIDLVHLMITDGNLKFAQLLRTALVDKLNQLMTEKTSPALGESFIGNVQRKQSIMDYSPENIARQMTILDNQLFQKVDVCEMLYWAKEQNEEKSPMLTLFTLHFNNVSQWTKATLLKRGLDMKNRCKLLLHFIAIMKSLLETFNNFNSYLAILSAIEAAPISRLDWNDKILKGLEEPRQLIDNRGSFKNYRVAFAQAKPPCIPYIGLYLQDLTFIEMQPSKLAEDPSAINFTKRWKQFKSVDHIRFAQTKQYTFKADPELLNLFKNFEVKETDEELWSISTEIKPSNRTMRTNQS